MNLRKVFVKLVKTILVLALLPFLLIVALISRFMRKKIDIGLGPEPLINNVYHKRALEFHGYSAETFVTEVYFITDQFDIRVDQKFFDAKSSTISRYLSFVNSFYLFFLSLLRYKCLYIYFNGGPLGVFALETPFLKVIEPLIYKLAGVKVVVLPYGGDVQVLTRTHNLLYKHFAARDYPAFRTRRGAIARQIDLWTRHADHVVSGCDWVEYMYHWDTLMLAHFSIDLEYWTQPFQHQKVETKTIRILHAPNHRAIKGTEFFEKAVHELQAEGLDLELVLAERVPNKDIRELMASVDIVADQLIIGWYAMFALEGMAMGKPVLCYLRGDLENLYVVTGLVQPGEIPIVNCTPQTVKEQIRNLVENREKIVEIGKNSREFVQRHHSIQAVGQVFDKINRSLGIEPSGGSRGP